jgi:hypothetical protein
MLSPAALAGPEILVIGNKRPARTVFGQTIATVDTNEDFPTRFRRQADISAGEAGRADIGETQPRGLCRWTFNYENILQMSRLEMQVDSYPVSWWSTKRLVDSRVAVTFVPASF